MRAIRVVLILGVLVASVVGGSALVRAQIASNDGSSGRFDDLPQLVPVAGPDGETVGFAPRDELVAQDKALGDAIDVRDKSGHRVGVIVPPLPFMDTATYERWKASGGRIERQSIEVINDKGERGYFVTDVCRGDGCPELTPVDELLALRGLTRAG
jgi:hypothetical protein